MDKLETIDELVKAVRANAAANDYDEGAVNDVIDHLAWMRRDELDERDVFDLGQVLRARACAERIARMKFGAKALDRDLDGYIVLDDDGQLVFLAVRMTRKPLGSSKVTRADRIAFEKAVSAYLEKHGKRVPEMGVRLDVIDFQVFEDAHKALTRYHVDAMNRE